MSVIFPTPTATKFGVLDIGDANVKGDNLLSVLHWLCGSVAKLTNNFNRQNEGRPVPAPTVNDDIDNKQFSFSGEFSYQVVKDDVTGLPEDLADDYLKDYAGWTVPTTGYFVGVKSIVDALYKLADYMTYVADQLEPGGVYISPSGFVTAVKDSVSKRMTITVNNGINVYYDADGNQVTKADNWAKVIDDQQGYV